MKKILKHFKKNWYRYGLETLVVVMGVLIAFSLNNWNEQGKENKNEQKVLASLLQDFQHNLINLDHALKLYPEMEEREIKMLRLMGLDDDSLNKMDPLDIIRTEYLLTVIVDGTLNSILNSEKLEIIKDEELKKLLTSYPSAVRKFKKREENLEKLILDIQRPLIEKYVSLTDLLDSLNPNFQIIKAKAVTSNYSGLLNDLQYQNVLMHRYFTSIELTEAAIELKSQTVATSNLLKKNLEIR
jgi:hypothetical protein